MLASRFSTFRRAALVVASITMFLIAAQAINAWASGKNDVKNGLQSLESFVKTAQSGRATFTQVVTSPAREGQAPVSKTSSGTF